jgi:hypothetical protein
MRRLVLTVSLVACVTFLLAGATFARTPDVTKCTVTDGRINTCPYVHPVGGDSERYVDLVVTVLNENSDPIEGYPAANFSFGVAPHSAYPNLGGGVGGDCPGCASHYTVSCIDAATNIDGEMNIRVNLGNGCAPSMCCPVQVTVTLPQGAIADKGAVLENTYDLVANGDNRGPDFAAFATAYVPGVGGTLEQCIDYITTGETWGTITGSDFASFGTHYMDCCGRLKEPTPALCSAFTDPCP